MGKQEQIKRVKGGSKKKGPLGQGEIDKRAPSGKEHAN